MPPSYLPRCPKFLRKSLARSNSNIYRDCNPGSYAVICLNAVEILWNLSDPQGSKEANAMRNQSHLVYLHWVCRRQRVSQWHDLFEEDASDHGRISPRGLPRYASH
ncbi:hypothetical protein BD414DRAFT_495292 [Trametes punicea]|nr:hypothetical protein BD414DRAFT_495292 [Trametes punicea]